MRIDFKPPKSVEGFLRSDAFISLIVGPVGSTKTTAGIMKIAYHAKQQAKGVDGIRRSRCVWVRNTNQMLHDTSIPDFLKWFPDGVAGEFAKVQMRFVLKFDDVVCEVLFRGLEDANDVRRVLALQISFAVLDEFRELNQQIFEALQGRLGRYPDKTLVPPRPEWGVDKDGLPIGGCVTDTGASNKHIWGMTNPPDMDTFWETLLTEPPNNAEVFFQPSGLSQEADWLQYLPSEYYANLAEGKKQEWIDVFINAKFGESLAGRPVFGSFKTDIHVAKEPLIVQSSPLIIGVDAGLTPTASICQLDYQGRLLVHNAVTGDNMGALRFIREVLKPLLANKFPGKSSIIVIDPAAFQRAQTDEKTVADMFKNEGFLVKPALTNTITARLASVDGFLTRTVDGKPAILFDKAGCPTLILAMRSKYRYKTNTKGETDIVPEKSHPWSDLCVLADTLISTPTGYVPIVNIAAGDVVTTPTGQQRVVAAGCVSGAAEVWEYEFTDGSRLTATPDHPVYVETEKGFVPLDKVRYTDVLVCISTPKERAQWQKQQNSGLMESGSTDTPGTIISGISRWLMGGSVPCPCTVTCGSTTTARSRMGWLSTIWTMTPPTTRSAIWSSEGAGSTRKNTWPSVLPTAGWAVLGLLQRGKLPRSGTLPKKEGPGTVSTASSLGKTARALLRIVRTAANLMKHFVGPGSAGSAHQLASLPREEPVASTMPRVTAPYAAPSLFATNIQKSRHAVSLVGKRRLPQPAAVYTLQVENEPMYFANGILVKNCDSLQYACMHADNGASFGAGKHTAVKREVKRVNYVYA